jgi:hypothetical protein
MNEEDAATTRREERRFEGCDRRADYTRLPRPGRALVERRHKAYLAEQEKQKDGASDATVRKVPQ